MEDTVYRLIYKSKGIKEIDWETIESILHCAEKDNTEHEISGLLLSTNTHFLQILEGRYEDINDTFMKIARDDRHTDVKLISFEVTDARLFQGWGMRGIGVFNFNQDIERMLMDKYGEENGSVRFPLEQWRVLAMVNDINMVHNLPSWKT